jgi:hypothetical protein
MRVREATIEDRARWDSFVDAEDGSFFHYFDWKYVYEARGNQFIPLLAETDQSQLIGILPVAKEKRLFYSTLDSLPEGASGGCLIKRGLSDEEGLQATSALLQYLDTDYSRGCSTFTLNEDLTLAAKECEDPTAALTGNGFRFIFDKSTGLPCTHVLELKQPFEENIWKGWSRMLRRGVNKAEENGVVVIQDRELKYAEDFIDMLYENYRRHRTKPPTRDEIMVRLNVFRDRSKLFVALLDGRPIVTLLCHYAHSTCYMAKVGSYEKDTDDANKLCYKVAIEDACNAGYRFVEFGITATPGLAFFKERFKGTRVPMRIYEKSYSIWGTLLEKAPVLVSNAWHDRSYIWKNRRLVWDRIVHI